MWAHVIHQSGKLEPFRATQPRNIEHMKGHGWVDMDFRTAWVDMQWHASLNKTHISGCFVATVAMQKQDHLLKGRIKGKKFKMDEHAVATCHFNSILWQALAFLLIQVVTCLHRLTLLRGLCRTLVVAVLLRQSLFRSQCEAWRRTDEIFLPCCDEYLCSQAFSNVLVFVLQTARW